MPEPAFAYLRRLPDTDDKSIQQTVEKLIAFIEQQGFALAGVYYEEDVSERLTTWCELIADCRNEAITTVAVPSSEHFHHNPELATFIREELATTIHGTVWLASEAGAAADRDDS